MRILLAATIVAAMSSATATAQTTPSTSDAPAPAGQNKTADPKQASPGTMGAMHDKSAPIATSPQDVKQQQDGKGTAAMPEAASDAGSAGDKTSPGTVGATPGGDSSQTAPK